MLVERQKTTITTAGPYFPYHLRRASKWNDSVQSHQWTPDLTGSENGKAEEEIFAWRKRLEYSKQPARAISLCHCLHDSVAVALPGS